MAASEQQLGSGGSRRRIDSQLYLAVDRQTSYACSDPAHGQAYAPPVTPTGSKAGKAGCIPLTSPTLLSPPAAQRQQRSMRRQTLQSPRHRRQTSMVLGARNPHLRTSFARTGRLDADPPRLSLDSQRPAISHDGSPAAGYAGAARLCGHTRGESCPTLNITRIMRSISVSGGSTHRAGRLQRDRSELLRYHSAPIESPPSETALAMLSPVRSDDDARAPIAGNRNSLETCRLEQRLGSALGSLAYLDGSCVSKRHSVGGASSLSEVRHWPKTMLGAVREQNNGRGSGSPATVRADAGGAGPGYADAGATDSGDAGVQLPAKICTSGLRRRISARQREAGTPDITVASGFAPPSPPPSEGRQSFCSEAPARLPNAHSRPPSWSVASPGSSAQCTIPEATHKHHSRRSAVIAQTLRELESAGEATDSALEDKCGEEKMTITLKGPRKRDSQDAPRGSGEAPIPAVYLDGAASLWDHYVAELESSDFDPRIHIKRQRVSQLLRVPWNLEKLLWFGVAICFDALLHVFAVMPARFARACVKLATGAARDLPLLADALLASRRAQTIAAALPAAWGRHLAGLGARIRGARADGGGAARWVSPAQLFDFYRGLLLVVTCVVLSRIDAAQMYHAIRAQSSLKLYFIYSALDIFDRLLATFGHDALDALQSTVTDAWVQRRRAGAGFFALAQAYMLVHTLVMFCQAITLNVAVNAYSDQLLSLLISVQFVEIKSAVFKKWEKEMLFQIGCADIVERFQAIVFLFIIIVRNLVELAGSGFSPLFGAPPPTATAGSAVTPTAQPPVSFAAATPSAFAPLVPAWLSIPTVNRILTPVLMVLGSELLIDWIKHAFVTKLNWIRPEIYSHYIDVLSRDLACSRSGATARAVPPVTTNADDIISAGVADDEFAVAAGTDSSGDAATGALDEKIESTSDDGDGYHHVSACSSSDISDDQNEGPRVSESSTSAERPRTRSASILSHAVLKVVSWVQSTSATPEPTSSSSSRQCRHRRTHSVTKPQLFVDQSSRVARRLGLAPLPLACMIMLMLRQVAHILISSSRIHSTEASGGFSTSGGLLSWRWIVGWATAGWTVLDIVGWVAIGLIAYALLVWAKLAFSSRLMRFAWIRFQQYERRTGAESASPAAANLKQFDDATKKPDRDDFLEVGRLINKEPSEAEWEQQRPKWTMDNIERYSLFKSRIC